jgi:hypothetical protein
MARRAWTAAFAATLGALIMFAGGAQASPVLMISLDGLRPDDVTKAAERGVKVPNLQALMREGAYASGVTGVLPTLTYPSHTTLVTGVAPAEHGVSNNQTFDPEAKNQQGWYWYASDIRVPTLWQAAHAAGLKTANVHWPVSVGGTAIDENLPQIWRTGTPDDPKLLAALATPGLLPRLEATLGAYAQGIDETVEGDANRVRFAQAMLADAKQRLRHFKVTAKPGPNACVGLRLGRPGWIAQPAPHPTNVDRTVDAGASMFVAIVARHARIGIDHLLLGAV